MHSIRANSFVQDTGVRRGLVRNEISVRRIGPMNRGGGPPSHSFEALLQEFPTGVATPGFFAVVDETSICEPWGPAAMNICEVGQEATADARMSGQP